MLAVGRVVQGAQFARDEVGVADGGHRRGGLGLGSGAQCAVGAEHLHQLGVVAPALDDGVALGDGQPPALVVQEVDGHPHERCAGEVEEVFAVAVGELPEGQFAAGGRQVAQVVEDAGHPRGGVDELERPGVAVEGEGGPHDLVAFDDQVGGPLERLGVEGEFVADPEGGDVVVAVLGALAVHLDEHPGLGERDGVGVGDVGGQCGPVLFADEGEPGDGGARSGAVRAVRVAEGGAQPGHGAVREDVADAGLPACLAQRADEGDGADGVAAELEEVVVDADGVPAQDGGPDRGDGAFGGVAGLDVVADGGGGAARGGQRAPVELAVGGQRQGVECEVGGGHHVRREGLADAGAQRGRGEVVGAGAFGGDDVGDEFPGAGAVLADEGDGFGDGRVGGERGLDLAGLDAVAAEFDLVVGAGDEVEVAVGQYAGDVAGAVEPGRRPDRRGRAQSVRRSGRGGPRSRGRRRCRRSTLRRARRRAAVAAARRGRTWWCAGRRGRWGRVRW